MSEHHHIRDRPLDGASAAFCRLLLSVIVLAPERLNGSPALLTGNFTMMTSIDLENIDLRLLNLHLKEFFYGHTYPLHFVFLPFTVGIV